MPEKSVKELSNALRGQAMVYCQKKKKKRLLSFVIVGGGPTSVEFAAELHDFLKEDVHKWYPDLESLVKVTLVEGGKSLLGSFRPEVSSYTHNIFKKRNIEVLTGVPVKDVTQREIILSDGRKLPFEVAVWSTGVSPSSFVKKTPFELKNGRILIDNHLKVNGSQNIWAAGDCAMNVNSNLPPTAQVAEQEGKYIASLLNQMSKQPGSSADSFSPFHYRHRGMFAHIGGHESVLDSPHIGLSGFFAWLLWNAAYITQLVSVRNKIMIPLYWFKSYVFGRDLSRF
eukprot:TRINITY_DN251_c0_g1_i2.p1 TRINITY_DN251_c0_g1~~TRINITY_DN251_c0_g1_i2.p1  ORF type:complete len:284 (-),score=69.92 TRINITY_DN251_c0_g1_i2:864-1715(-)